jgi:hypothetical protein
MQREDAEHYFKYCTALHGEWFLDGKRIPRKNSEARTAD